MVVMMATNSSNDEDGECKEGDWLSNWRCERAEKRSIDPAKQRVK